MPRAPANRRAASVVEFFVALTLLTTTLSVAIPLIVRQQRILESARHYRIACDEIANQLERLSALPAANRDAALDSLEVSEFAAARLQEPELTATLDAADIGQRLTLSIAWGDPQRRQHPVSLVAWLAEENRP